MTACQRYECLKAFMTIFESSTSSQSSEGIDIKSEPNFYTSKTNDSESYKHNTNQYPKDGYRYKKFTSRWGHNNHQKQNAREKYGQWGERGCTNPLDISGNNLCCAIC